MLNNCFREEGGIIQIYEILLWGGDLVCVCVCVYVCVFVFGGDLFCWGRDL